MAKNKFNFGQIRKEFETLKQRLPKVIADESVSFFKKSFDKGGFQSGITFDRWAPRKDTTNTKRLMVDTGRLRRSIRIIQLGFNRSVVATDVPYAQIHNEGGDIDMPEREQVINFREHSTNISTRAVSKRFAKSKGGGRMKATSAMKVNVKAHKIHMPKRQFMGRSRTLDLRVNTMISQRIGRLFKK